MNWLFNISLVENGGSAILGGNYFSFYLIHYLAIVLILISLISCAFVILNILWTRRKSRLDFADRFPLYLALADGLWAISHFGDHFFLLTTHTYPNELISKILSINLWIFLGYQQMMNIGLSIYTYLRIVKGVNLNLGRGEWKLHTICTCFILGSISVFYSFDAFGHSGYWMLTNIKSTGGIAVNAYATTCTVIQALCTSLGYREIKKTLQRHKTVMAQHHKGTKNNDLSTDLNETASKCLTTFVMVSIYLYYPFAIFYIIFSVETAIFGVLEPFTPLLIVITANSMGWANALGYFNNRKIKIKREQAKLSQVVVLSGQTNCSSNNDSNSASTTETDK